MDDIPLNGMDSSAHINRSSSIASNVGMQQERQRDVFKWSGTELPCIDYVIVYDETKSDQHLRETFFNVLRNKKMELENYIHDDGSTQLTFVKIWTPFRTLAKEAERLKIEMPLDNIVSDLNETSCETSMGNCLKLTIDEGDDYISGTFEYKKLHLFQGHQNKDTFFRSSLRAYITYNILINADISHKKEAKDPTSSPEKNDTFKTALPNLIHDGVFLDAFSLHGMSAKDPFLRSLKQEWIKKRPDNIVFDESATTEERVKKGKNLSKVFSIGGCNFDYDYSPDDRKALNDTWTKVKKYQPLLGIRNYFGEKIAFYFAWSGHMISLLWSPTIFGVCIFFYGLSLSIQRRAITTTPSPQNTTELQKVMQLVDDMLGVVKEAFDNIVTPAFAIFICLWGTLHTELWKRYRATLAYEWDVNNYHHSEPDRPQFKGTHPRVDPITGLTDFYYPGSRQAVKFISSFMILLLMILIVFVGVAAVIVYRVFVTIKFCPTATSTACLVVNTVVSSILNAVFIIVMGKIYDKVAYLLTDWENHRSQSEYDNALIVKLFAFQFANSYASLFYIAFFRGGNIFISENGIFGLGAEYVDTCGSDGNCMSMLSFQVLILMIAKPIPKFLMDQVIPFARAQINKIRANRRKGQVEDGDTLPKQPTDVNAYIANEFSKPDLGDFTISEYMEKIIQFGYLMLFAASFPLAPLIALLTNLFDLSTDAYRLLWVFRRPVSHIAADIGMWADIVEFLNIAGVISNAFIIAFTASWTKDYPNLNSTQSRLILVLIVENAVLGLKYFMSAVIPDVPKMIYLQIRREQYRVPKIMAAENLDDDNADIEGTTKKRTKKHRKHKRKKSKKDKSRTAGDDDADDSPVRTGLVQGQSFDRDDDDDDIDEDIEENDEMGVFGPTSRRRRRGREENDNPAHIGTAPLGRHDTTDLMNSDSYTY